MVLFDVGAHDGKDSMRLLTKLTRNSYYESNGDYYYENDKVYAFEPTAYLVDRFLKVLQKGLPAGVFTPIQKAVSDIEGTFQFNIAGKKPGCSSLNEFSDNLNESWPEIKSFKVTDQVEVETIRLDNFIKQNNIEQIDHLHCDVQGHDLKVLKSLGNDIEKVVAGRVEAYNYNPLYKNTDNSVLEIIEYLDSYGMRVKNRDLLLDRGHKDIMPEGYKGHKYKEVNIKFYGPRYSRDVV